MTALNTRQREMAALLASDQTASVSQLAQQFRVSDETVRRDLKVLERLCQIERYHGGVRYIGGEEEAPFAQRLRTQMQAKAALARAAAALIPDGASLVLDNSSTACFLARALAGKQGLTVLTPSIEVAQALLQTGAGHRVMLPPGELRAADRTVVGAGVIDYLRQFMPDYFVFSVAAVGPGHLCLDYDLFEAQFKQAALAQARQALLMADSSKYGLPAPLRVCAADCLDWVAVETMPPGWANEAAREAGATIVMPEVVPES